VIHLVKVYWPRRWGSTNWAGWTDERLESSTLWLLFPWRKDGMDAGIDTLWLEVEL